MRTVPIKVCIVAISLAKGGLERSTALLSKMLSHAGYEVHIVLLTNAIDYEYAGQLLNLGLLKHKNETALSRWGRLLGLKKHIRQNTFDYIIDARSRRVPLVEMIYLFYFYRKTRKVYMVHSFKTENYLTNSSFFAKLILNNCDAVVCVSEGIKKSLEKEFHCKNAVKICNAIEKLETENQELPSTNFPQRYILYLGRIEDKTKNIKLLIDAYKLSGLYSYQISLLIVGDGPDKTEIAGYIAEKGLAGQVLMLPFTCDVYGYLANALFLVLTSRHEGFPMVLIEALSVGTPVVSVDCQTGPAEIIVNGFNGLLVENFNPEAFAAAIVRMVEDDELYSRCKQNARQSIEHLSPQNIEREWMRILR